MLYKPPRPLNKPRAWLSSLGMPRRWYGWVHRFSARQTDGNVLQNAIEKAIEEIASAAVRTEAAVSFNDDVAS